MRSFARRRAQSAWSEFLQHQINQTTNDLGEVAEDIVHDEANKYSGKEGTDATDSYFKKHPLDKGLPTEENFDERPSKRRKKASSMNLKFRSRAIKRPLKRRRILKRKPSRKRPYVKKMGGLKKMIKKIARDSAEPKRYLWGPDQNIVEGFTIQKSKMNCFRMDDIPKHSTAVGFENTSGTYHGKEYFLKGIRIKGYMYNPSQYPVTVRMMATKTKSKLTEDNTFASIMAGDLPQFYDPTTAEAKSLLNLPRLFKYNAKITPTDPLKIIKSQLFVMDSSRKETGVTNDETNVDSSGGIDDLKHFDWYIPINRTQRAERPVPGDTFFDRQINHFLHFYFTSVVVEDDVNAFPQCYFTGITYFKDM